MRQAHEKVFIVVALDHNTAVVFLGLARLAIRSACGRVDDLVERLFFLRKLARRTRVENGCNLVANGANGGLAGTDACKKVLERLVVELVGNLIERARGARSRNAVTAFAQVLGKNIAPGSRIVILGGGGKIPADLGTCRRSLDDIEPVTRRLGVLVGQNLDAVAHLELVRKRCHRPVDFGADAVVTDLGVHGVRKIERRGARAQAHDLAFGREDKNLLIE